MKTLKSFLFSKYSNIFPFIIYIVAIIICDIICATTDFDFHLKKRLNNGNYLILSTQGIYLYNELFNLKQDIVKFNSRLAGSNNDMNSANVAQFLSEDNGYVICLILNNVYIITKKGEYKYNFTLDYIQREQGYQIVPYKSEGNIYHYFVIINTEKNAKRIDIRKYKYDSNNNNVEFIEYYNITRPHEALADLSNYLGCELMNYLNQKVICCFYCDYQYTYYIAFETDNFAIIANRSEKVLVTNVNGGLFLVSNVNSTGRENAVCCTQHNRDLTCFGYNIVTNEFTEAGIIINQNSDYGCRINVLDMQIEYFPETNEFLMGCKDQGNNYFIGKLNSSDIFTIYDKQEIIPVSDSSTTCNTVNLFHFTYYAGSYSIVTDSSNCQNDRVVTIDYIKSIKIQDYPSDEVGITITCTGYIKYDTFECVDSIVDGYFYNGTSEKIIYKCHSMCKKCEKEGDDENPNCKTCKNNKYLDMGNCTSSCHGRGHFTHPDYSSQKVCNCSIPKCLYCTQESLSYNELCVICNTDESYFPMENDPNKFGEFINCYQNLSGYYLDSNIYKPCYSTCKNCDGKGNDTNNNCNECDDNHIFDSNKKNCYDKCTTNYYYFDENEDYKCVDSCPNNYKLIYSTSKCVDDCSKAGTYKYEFNKTCYENCPPGTFYSYDRSECLSEVPKGYYCNSTNEQTIDVCYVNCGSCLEKGNDTDNKCLTCKNTENNNYLDSGNCVSSCNSRISFNDPEDESIIRCKCNESKCLYCSVESLNNNLCILCYKNGGYYPKKDDITSDGLFIDCYNITTISGPYYLNSENEQYEPCYSSCSLCSILGDYDNHQCIQCKEGYDSIINNNNHINCYQRCEHYYYFDKDDSDKYKCTDNDTCPLGYKLINSTKKCIDDCSKDNIFNCTYEYQNKCYNKLLCEHFYNYEHNECIVTINEGYYCNSTDEQTIDKCHDNCKTCTKGGTDENNNCDTCKVEGTKYFDFGNCKETCENGNFTDIDLVLKCKCSYNISCEKCDEDSNGLYSCITCNNEKGYYKKSDEERNDGFINCYKNLEGYYLDDNIYYPCFNTCKHCLSYGNEEDNKCKECKDGYTKKNDSINDNICYKNCDYNKYYYETSNNNRYTCTIDDNCPEDFPKYISSKNRCIDDCTKDNIYKYEYNGVCVIGCPQGSHNSNENEFLCEGDLNCEQKNQYYNHDFTACIDNIEEGYYCDDQSLKTLAKCHDNCKTCTKGGTDENNNCDTCKVEETKYFDFGNCKETCENGNFTDIDSILKCKCSYNISCEKCDEDSNGLYSCITCNNEKGYYKKSDEERNDGFINCYKNLEGYYLDDNIYYPCFNTCKHCLSYGNEEDNKCIECKDGYSKINDTINENNCYKICDPYYYYFDSNNKYKCTNDYNCPSDFSKLIMDKKRCINDCSIYHFYEYNNECINDCPSGYHIINNKCIEDLKCENKNKYYNYEKTECIDDIPVGFYCNNNTLKTIDKCHSNCKTCLEGGTDENNNCKTCKDEGTKYFDLSNCKSACEIGHFIDEDNINKCKCSKNKKCKLCSAESNQNDLCLSCNKDDNYYPKINDESNIDSFVNCYNDDTISCMYYFYLNKSNYYCTLSDNCTDEFKFFIPEKKKCIDDCTKDNKYKFKFGNICYESCPKNTKVKDKNICEHFESNTSKIAKTVDNLVINFPVKNITCENDYVEFEEDINYEIYIFQNNDCPEELQKHPSIEFGECYYTIKEINNIDEDNELIVSKVIKKNNFSAYYSFYDPNTLDKLDSSPCEGQKITVEQRINEKINNTMVLNLIEQGINVFDPLGPFYTDICYHYESSNGKDIPLKVRISAFFPNITLCENGCETIGIDTRTMKAKCECKFIDLVNIDIIGDNLYTEAIKEILEIISEINIAVIKCFKDIFKKKYFVKNTGGFIIISLFMGQLICFIKYAIDGLYYIRKYLFDLTESYKDYNNMRILKNNISIPPKKKQKGKSKSVFNLKNMPSNLNSNILDNSKISSKKNLFDSSEKGNIIVKKQKNLFYPKKAINGLSKLDTTYKKGEVFFDKNPKIYRKLDNKKNKINIKEYLSTSFDENDYDDVIDKDKRKFCSYFCQKFQMNQIFISTFIIKEPFRPISLKILVLIMTIELYFAINALFYNEDYLSDLFYSTKEEKFFSFIPRRINKLIYTSAVSGLISYFVGYVFIDEKKIKKIFIRNKEIDIKMKYEISLVVKNIGNKFTTIITFSIVLSLVCFIYISCFNNVYPYIKIEWLKSSLFILIFMQFFNVFMTFIECIIRYAAIKCKSERIFRLSQVFAL